jgi:pyruvate/2-oxoglutarate dehydrogenase complex dihydrolipoamide acyltransferase (E2) component
MSVPIVGRIVGRITQYEGSNVHIGTKILFIVLENRESTQENFPVGTIVKAAHQNGTCKGMEKAAGYDLQKFLTDEEVPKRAESVRTAEEIAAERETYNTKAKTSGFSDPTPGPAPAAAPAAAQKDCTSPESSAPAAAKKSDEPGPRDIFSPRDRLIVAQCLVKAYTDLWCNTHTPDSVTFDDARKEILAVVKEDLPRVMEIGGAR